MKEKVESETSHSVIDVESSLALPQGAGNSGGNRGGLFRTPISGGVQNATSAHALPRPALAVRNLLEQVKRSVLSDCFRVPFVFALMRKMISYFICLVIVFFLE